MHLKTPNHHCNKCILFEFYQYYSCHNIESKIIIKKFLLISYVSKNNLTLDKINPAPNLKDRFW